MTESPTGALKPLEADLSEADPVGAVAPRE